jgi:nucleoside permease NupC
MLQAILDFKVTQISSIKLTMKTTMINTVTIESFANFSTETQIVSIRHEEYMKLWVLK